MTAPEAPTTAGEVDLHMHSTASDGCLAPAQVVAAASAAGLAAIALTDHDTMSGFGEAADAGARLRVRVVPGVELSAHEGNREIHLLALHVSRAEVMEPRLSGFRHAREARAQQIVARLRRMGIAIDNAEVLREAAGGAVGRPHIARVLVRAAVVSDSREAFDRLLGAGRPAYVPKERLEVAEAISLAHAAGALAIWAHPGVDCRRNRLEPLVALGLDGVEVKHPSHLSEDVRRLQALADFFGLVPSGGSDWHGVADSHRTIGSMHVPHAWLDLQDSVVAEKRTAEVA